MSDPFVSLLGNGEANVYLRRKMLASIISSLFFAFIFSVPGGFEMNTFANLYYLIFMFVVT